MYSEQIICVLFQIVNIRKKDYLELILCRIKQGGRLAIPMSVPL